MAASAIAMFSSAKRRAFWSMVLPERTASPCAIVFQCPGGVSVPAPSAQNRAIVSWSDVRADPRAAPRALTSL